MGKRILGAILLGSAIEMVAAVLLAAGTWEFMGEVDVIGKAGVILHYPGFALSRAMQVYGAAAWIVILGVPLLLWIAVAHSGLVVRDILRGRTSS